MHLRPRVCIVSVPCYPFTFHCNPSLMSLPCVGAVHCLYGVFVMCACRVPIHSNDSIHVVYQCACRLYQCVHVVCPHVSHHAVPGRVQARGPQAAAAAHGAAGGVERVHAQLDHGGMARGCPRNSLWFENRTHTFANTCT